MCNESIINYFVFNTIFCNLQVCVYTVPAFPGLDFLFFSFRNSYRELSLILAGGNYHVKTGPDIIPYTKRFSV